MTSSEGVAQERVCPRCGGTRAHPCEIDPGSDWEGPLPPCDDSFHDPATPSIEGQQEGSTGFMALPPPADGDAAGWKALALLRGEQYNGLADQVEKAWADLAETEAALSAEHSKRLEAEEALGDSEQRVADVSELVAVEWNRAERAEAQVARYRSGIERLLDEHTPTAHPEWLPTHLRSLLTEESS